MRHTRTVTTIGAVAAAAMTATLSPATAVEAESYVALGDSYSSGTGTRDYLNDGTACERSPRSYPSLIAAAEGFDLNLRACSGATTADVTASQLSALSASTDRVSISVGGNDANFVDVLTACATPAWAGNCDAAIDRAEGIINNTLPGRFNGLFSSIREKAPKATVVVLGYPRIFNGEDCNALTWFSPEEQSRLNAAGDLLNSRLQSAASARGFTFANPSASFTGHAVCDDVEWLNGLSEPITESYHPNRAGHRDGFTPLVSAPLAGSPSQVTTQTTQRADAQASDQAQLQRRYAEEDRTIEPKRLRLPDLNSARMRQAAQRAGVDLDSRASIDAADRTWSKRKAALHR